MRIVVGGEDEVAFRLAEALMEDHEVVLVTSPEAPSTRLERLDVEVVSGSVSSPQTQREAEVGQADLFVACAGEDERNLVACIAAKKLGAARTVGFFQRREYVRPLEAGERPIAESFGIDTVIWPAERLAEEIARIVETPGALDLEVFAGGRVHLLKYAVAPGSDLAGRTVRETGVPEGVVLVSVRRGERMELPRGDTRLEVGDKVIGMGDRRGVQRLAARLAGEGRGQAGGDVAIVGGGSVGQMVAERLEAAGGFRLKIVEAVRARCEEVSKALRSSLVLHGDGTDLDLLESERIHASAVLVAVTNKDEKNLLVSLLARQLGIPRIVTRADSIANERLFERVGIDVVRSARGSAIQAVVSLVSGGRSEILAEVEHGDARVLELTVPEGTAPVRLKDLRAPVFAIVGAILRPEGTTIPRGDDLIRGGDHLVVFCDRASEESARAFFGHGFAAQG